MSDDVMQQLWCCLTCMALFTFGKLGMKPGSPYIHCPHCSSANIHPADSANRPKPGDVGYQTAVMARWLRRYRPEQPAAAALDARDAEIARKRELADYLTSEPLGKEFEQVLHDNLPDLYVRSDGT